jgi:hypothetical protein
MTFSATKHKKRGAKSGLGWAKRIKCTMAPLLALHHKNEEQIPKGLIQQTMMGLTKGLDVTTGAQNPAAKI